MANNGKAMLNEPCKRGGKIERTICRLMEAVRIGDIDVICITEKDFKEKFPRFSPNNGGRKRQTKPPTK